MARGVRLKSRPSPEPPCPNEAEHTDVRGQDEAARMWRTHEQSQCPDCRLYVIWTRLPAGSFVTCWLCSQRNVDPATLGEDDGIPDVPLCDRCQDLEAAYLENDRRRWAAEQARRRWQDAT